ncbi:MAG: dTDP-4-dehydrorhamnose reductase, partial [Bacteroidota bacterium]|nr:dTDP-4-dehydrorhamnose reductase [Bacteroidota bacterium]
MNNILVTGSGGQLGSELRIIALNFPNHNLLFTNRNNLDITDYKAVKNFIKINKINAIINCAAYTALDKAETEPTLADAINHLAVANFAKLSKENNIKLIHISSDYVFDGNSQEPYTETDTPNPQSVYGQTKLDGELAIQKINPANSIIIRTAWLYSKFGNNFVKKMLRLGKNSSEISVVSDQFGTPTNAADLALAILKILPRLHNTSVELFHYSNEGVCSWYDFALEIFKIRAIKTVVNTIKTSEFPTLVKRPAYSVLDKAKIKTFFDLAVPFW